MVTRSGVSAGVCAWARPPGGRGVGCALTARRPEEPEQRGNEEPLLQRQGGREEGGHGEGAARRRGPGDHREERGAARPAGGRAIVGLRRAQAGEPHRQQGHLSLAAGQRSGGHQKPLTVTDRGEPH